MIIPTFICNTPLPPVPEKGHPVLKCPLCQSVRGVRVVHTFAIKMAGTCSDGSDDITTGMGNEGRCTCGAFFTHYRYGQNEFYSSNGVILAGLPNVKGRWIYKCSNCRGPVSSTLENPDFYECGACGLSDNSPGEYVGPQEDDAPEGGMMSNLKTFNLSKYTFETRVTDSNKTSLHRWSYSTVKPKVEEESYGAAVLISRLLESYSADSVEVRAIPSLNITMSSSRLGWHMTFHPDGVVLRLSGLERTYVSYWTWEQLDEHNIADYLQDCYTDEPEMPPGVVSVPVDSKPQNKFTITGSSFDSNGLLYMLGEENIHLYEALSEFIVWVVGLPGYDHLDVDLEEGDLTVCSTCGVRLYVKLKVSNGDLSYCGVEDLPYFKNALKSDFAKKVLVRKNYPTYHAWDSIVEEHPSLIATYGVLELILEDMANQDLFLMSLVDVAFNFKLGPQTTPEVSLSIYRRSDSAEFAVVPGVYSYTCHSVNTKVVPFEDHAQIANEIAAWSKEGLLTSQSLADVRNEIFKCGLSVIASGRVTYMAELVVSLALELRIPTVPKVESDKHNGNELKLTWFKAGTSFSILLAPDRCSASWFENGRLKEKSLSVYNLKDAVVLLSRFFESV